MKLTWNKVFLISFISTLSVSLALFVMGLLLGYFFNIKLLSFIDFSFSFWISLMIIFCLLIVFIFNKDTEKSSVLDKFIKSDFIKYNKFKELTVLSIIFAIFLILQIYKIYNSGIGTDEGNFLYTTKLILSGKKIFIDFWSRESGSLVFLVPWFKIFPISIINLRWLIAIIHTLSFICSYYIISKIETNRKIRLIIFFISIVLLSFNSIFEIYTGIFYQVSTLLNLLIVLLLLKLFFSPINKIKSLIILGLVIGFSILVYKGCQMWLPIVIFYLSVKGCRDYKRLTIQSLSFLLASFIPIFVYWVYYASYTSFHHIYKVLLSDIVINYSIILLFTLLGIIIFKYIKLFINIIANRDNILLISLLPLAAILSFRFIKMGQELFSTFYGGLILNYGFLVIIWQIVNIGILNRHKKIFVVIFIFFNIIFAYLGFGARGFFTEVSLTYHYFAITVFAIYNFYLFISLFYKMPINKDQTLLFYGILINLMLALPIIGSDLMPIRYHLILIILPILFILLLRVNLNKKHIPIIVVGVSCIFSFYINLSLKNDYTFYSHKDFSDTVEYLNHNTEKESVVFSMDTSILSEMTNRSLLALNSPWIYIADKPVYYYENIKKDYANKDMSLDKHDLYIKIKKNRPEYIVGSWRSTMRIFENEDWYYFLIDNYDLIFNNKRLFIYSRK